MKQIFFTIIILLLVQYSKSQSIKNGITYDTLTTIENGEFIVNEAIIAYRDEGYGTRYAKLQISLLAKKNIKIKFTKLWIGCYENDFEEGSKEWGGNKYLDFDSNKVLFNKTFDIEWEYIDSVPSMKIKCEPNSTKHIVRGFVFEYYLDDQRKYLVIDKFKFIEGFKLDEYVKYRTYILKNKK